MFDEDLPVFFDLDGHAVTAAVKNASGVSVGSMAVILDVPLDEVVVLEGGVEQAQPRATCMTGDILALGVKHKFTLTAGGVVYVVTGRDDDGTGVSTLRLRKQ